MYNRNANNIYAQNQILTASPKKLVSLLFEGCIKQLKLAVLHIEEKKMDQAHGALIKAQDILLELKGTLNFEEGGEIAEQLDQLYAYLLEQLIQANLKKDAAIIRHCEQMVQELRETWEQI